MKHADFILVLKAFFLNTLDCAHAYRNTLWLHMLNEILKADTHVCTTAPADMTLPLNPVSDAAMYGEPADFYGGKNSGLPCGTFIV